MVRHHVVHFVFILAACHIPGPLPFSTGPELPNCGDLVVDPGEMCDDGPRNHNQRGICTEQCTVPYCGDGLVHEPTEQCDPGSDDSGLCFPDCTLPASCGDGIVHELETCDLGPENSDLPYGTEGCSLQCKPIPYCGDGTLDETYETCDDGNFDDHDACTNDCLPNVCGDGLVYTGFEDCDDANQIDTDACLTTCKAASCGDGVVHDEVEECDGQSDCGPTCIRDRYVFATEESFRGNFEIGLGATGVERADWLCQTRAEGEKLHLGAKFRAWISDDVSSPSTRFQRSEGRYILPDGTIFAESWDALTTGMLEAPPYVTEKLTEPLQGGAWTNTLPDGTAASSDEDCDAWSTKAVEVKGRLGGATFEDGRWTDYDAANPVTCGGDLHLYCFEQ